MLFAKYQIYVSNVGCSYIFFHIGFLCIQTLPALYERYEDEVDRLVAKGSHDLKKLYKRLDSEILSKIPRGPAVTKKD